MIEFSIAVTLRDKPRIGKWTAKRHEFRFCAESARDARYLASKNVPSQGFPRDEVMIEIAWTRPVYVPESSILFGPVPQKYVTVVKSELPPLKSCREMETEGMLEAEREFA